MRWVLLIFAFASCSEVAGQWCCAQIRPTWPGATLLSCWCSVRDEVGTGSWSPETVYWAYVTLWGGYFALIFKWQDTHQKVKSLVYSHRTGRGWIWGVWLSCHLEAPWTGGWERWRGVLCNLHPHHSGHFPDAGHAPGPLWTLTSQTNECPCVWGTHLLRSCWFPTLCRAWRNQSVYFCCLKTAYLTKNVLDLHNITCEKLNRHTSPREWKHIVNVLDVLIPYLYNLHKVHGSLGFTSEFFMCRHYPHHFQHVWRLFHAHVQSLSLHSNHHWLKSPNISFFCFCTWPAFSKATSFPLFNLLEGLFSPFIFRCAIHLEIILVHGMIYGGVDSPPQNTQLVQLIY